MKATCVLVCLSLVLSVAGDVSAQAPQAVRPMDAGALEAYEHGRDGSPAFRALVAYFDAASVVVHVFTGDTRVFGARGTTRLTGSVGPWRYLRVVLDPRLPLAERAAVLAHELQHAHEIVDGEAVTQRDVRQLYERIGRPVNGMTNAFETVAAAEAGTRVWHELRGAVATARHAAQ